MRNYPEIGLQVGAVLLPSKSVDPKRWAVIACDQFTSEPEYWDSIRQEIGDSPSTLHLILPEVYLGKPDETARVAATQAAMRAYLAQGVFQPRDGMVYVERAVDGKQRRGLVVALDLETYDFRPGSQSLIRATEGTILDRLPPRMRIREGAAVELPHILVLLDDPEDTVLGPLQRDRANLEELYNFDLLAGSGHLTGHAVDAAHEAAVVAALRKLASPEVFYPKYGLTPDRGVLLYAVGDGNHSLATAKSIWEKLKPTVGPDHPARYALVELENVHDHGLEFEPIHRVLFGVKNNPLEALQTYYGSKARWIAAESPAAMMETVRSATNQSFGLVTPEGAWVVELTGSASNLAVGGLQPFLDAWLKQGGAEKIDYVHGDAVVRRLGQEAGNAGFFLPPMPKSELFRTVLLDGALPRKTFSMGEAHEKRFYMEARQIA